jgi:hypothetical protein
VQSTNGGAVSSGPSGAMSMFRTIMNIDIAPEGPEDTAPPLVLCTKSWPTHRLPLVQSTNGGAVSSGPSGAMSMFIIVH